MENLKDLADNVRGSLIPQFYILRRVPTRYRQVLPLTIMKRFRCIVVGSAPGVLTVAITDRYNTTILESLKKFTGQAIFPVLIDPTRMQLLIQRIERYHQCSSCFYSKANKDPMKTQYYQCAILRLYTDSLITLLSSQEKRRL